MVLRLSRQGATMSDHVDRRTFLKRAGAAGAGAVIASRLPTPGSASAQDATVRPDPAAKRGGTLRFGTLSADRKSTRLNSSHMSISYAVFCLKKKKYN